MSSPGADLAMGARSAHSLFRSIAIQGSRGHRRRLGRAPLTAKPSRLTGSLSASRRGRSRARGKGRAAVSWLGLGRVRRGQGVGVGAVGSRAQFSGSPWRQRKRKALSGQTTKRPWWRCRRRRCCAVAGPRRAVPAPRCLRGGSPGSPATTPRVGPRAARNNGFAGRTRAFRSSLRNCGGAPAGSDPAAVERPRVPVATRCLTLPRVHPGPPGPRPQRWQRLSSPPATPGRRACLQARSALLATYNEVDTATGIDFRSAPYLNTHRRTARARRRWGSLSPTPMRGVIASSTTLRSLQPAAR